MRELRVMLSPSAQNNVTKPDFEYEKSNMTINK